MARVALSEASAGQGTRTKASVKYRMMNRTITDADAISQSLLDPECFAVVFNRHFATIRTYIARRLGPELADELTADTFVQAFRGRHGYDTGRPDAGPWLFGIAANIVRLHRRTERRKLMAYARTGIDPVAQPDSEAVHERVDADAAGPMMARALAALRDGDRDVLLLFAWAELSYEEIATALGVPVGTVRSRLHRARRRVRELLDADGSIDATEPGGSYG